MALVKTQLSGQPLVEVDYDFASGEMRFEENSTLTRTVHGGITVSQNTADTSGDLQIRDDSSGDLFSLDDGNSPSLSVRYEGDGAFTLGYRDTADGSGPNSIVLGGKSTASNKAAGSRTVAIGFGNIAGFSPEFDVGTDDVFCIGESNEIILGDNYVTGKNNTVESDNCFVYGKGNTVSGSNAANSFLIGKDNTVSNENSYLFGENLIPNNVGAVTLGRFNEDISGKTYGNAGFFAIGAGAGTNDRDNSFFVDYDGSSTFTHSDVIFLNTDQTHFENTNKQVRTGIIDKNVSISDYNVRSSLLVGESQSVSFSGNVAKPLKDSIFLSSSITNSDVGVSRVFAIDSTFDSINYSSLTSSLFVSTDVDSTNLDEFRLSSSGVNPSVVAFDNDTLRVYLTNEFLSSGEGRQRSVGLIGGSLDGASHSLSIGDTTVSTNNTVGIGNPSYVDVSDSEALRVEDTSGIGKTLTADTTSGDIELHQSGQGVILTSPDGTRFRVHVKNDGTLVSTELP